MGTVRARALQRSRTARLVRERNKGEARGNPSGQVRYVGGPHRNDTPPGRHPRVLGQLSNAVQFRMDGIGKAQSAAIGGLKRAGDMMTRAASQVARSSVESSSSAAKVSISSEGRTLAQTGDSATQDSFEEPLIGSQVAKHMNAANVKVLQTTDETLKELTKIKR